MECSITKVGENIMVTKDFRDIKNRGEAAHFIAELELIKQELLQIFDSFDMRG